MPIFLSKLFLSPDLLVKTSLTNKNQTPIWTNSVLEENTHIFGSYVRTKNDILREKQHIKF
jgi:hypothetical protein